MRIGAAAPTYKAATASAVTHVIHLVLLHRYRWPQAKSLPPSRSRNPASLTGGGGEPRHPQPGAALRQLPMRPPTPHTKHTSGTPAASGEGSGTAHTPAGAAPAAAAARPRPGGASPGTVCHARLCGGCPRGLQLSPSHSHHPSATPAAAGRTSGQAYAPRGSGARRRCGPPPSPGGPSPAPPAKHGPAALMQGACSPHAPHPAPLSYP